MCNVEIRGAHRRSITATNEGPQCHEVDVKLRVKSHRVTEHGLKAQYSSNLSLILFLVGLLDNFIVEAVGAALNGSSFP